MSKYKTFGQWVTFRARIHLSLKYVTYTKPRKPYPKIKACGGNRANLETRLKMEKRVARKITSSNYETRSKTILDKFLLLFSTYPFKIVLTKPLNQVQGRAMTHTYCNFVNTFIFYIHTNVYVAG